jgi:hypothetical protein
MFIYTLNFPIEFYGTITKGIFNITFENYSGTFNIFNSPMIVFFILFVMNIVLIINLGDLKEIENKDLREVLIMNTFLTFIMILGQILFIVLVPNQINGLIEDKIIFINMPVLATNIVKVFNINYILAVIYIGYNMYVTFKSIPEGTDKIVEKEIDEELYEKQFFDSLVENVKGDKK